MGYEDALTGQDWVPSPLWSPEVTLYFMICLFGCVSPCTDSLARAYQIYKSHRNVWNWQRAVVRWVGESDAVVRGIDLSLIA